MGIDIVGKGLSSNHIESNQRVRMLTYIAIASRKVIYSSSYILSSTSQPTIFPQEAIPDKRYLHSDKEPLRAPSGVYGQRVHPSISPDDGTQLPSVALNCH